MFFLGGAGGGIWIRAESVIFGIFLSLVHLFPGYRTATFLHFSGAYGIVSVVRM